jgi:hypothetical protein
MTPRNIPQSAQASPGRAPVSSADFYLPCGGSGTQCIERPIAAHVWFSVRVGSLGGFPPGEVYLLDVQGGLYLAEHCVVDAAFVA